MAETFVIDGQESLDRIRRTVAKSEDGQPGQGMYDEGPPRALGNVKSGRVILTEPLASQAAIASAVKLERTDLRLDFIQIQQSTDAATDTFKLDLGGITTAAISTGATDEEVKAAIVATGIVSDAQVEVAYVHSGGVWSIRWTRAGLPASYTGAVVQDAENTFQVDSFLNGGDFWISASEIEVGCVRYRQGDRFDAGSVMLATRLDTGAWGVQGECREFTMDNVPTSQTSGPGGVL